VGGTAATNGSAARGNSCYGLCRAAHSSAAKNRSYKRSHTLQSKAKFLNQRRLIHLRILLTAMSLTVIEDKTI